MTDLPVKNDPLDYLLRRHVVTAVQQFELILPLRLRIWIRTILARHYGSLPVTHDGNVEVLHQLSRNFVRCANHDFIHVLSRRTRRKKPEDNGTFK